MDSQQSSQGPNGWKQFVKGNKTAVSASIASVCSVLLGSPFDTVKVRMQTEKHSSTFTCAQSVYRNEGFRGFFRGIVPPLISVNVVKTVSVSVYESSRKIMLARFLGYKNGNCVGGRIDPPPQNITAAGVYFLSGFGAGVSTSFISGPLEMIRNQRILYDHKVLNGGDISMSMHRPSEATTFSYFQKLRKQGLVNGVYRGYGLHLIRECLGTGTYWLTYECLHWLPFVSSTGTRKGASGIGHFLAGGLTGMVSWVAIFPLDLVKNIYQKQAFSSKKMTVMDCIRYTYQKGGVGAFYRGVVPTMMRAFPIHGINLLIYEYFLSFFSKL